MDYKTHNETSVQSNGTGLVGYITTTYQELVEAFGMPSDNYDDYKSDAEWEVEFADGTVATIYNWKNGKNYCGEDGTHKTKITEWNVGGNSKEASRLVLRVLGNKKAKKTNETVIITKNAVIYNKQTNNYSK